MSRTLRRTVTGVLLVATAVLATALLGPGGDDGAPLDPRSTGPAGAAALVTTLEELGARVRVGGEPDPSTDVVLVLVDGLGETAREQLRSWTAAGGTLVVADPFSPLVGADTAGLLDVGVVGPLALRPGCSLAALEDVGTVRAARWTGLAVGGETERDATRRCFPVADGWWLVVEPTGRGTVVALGGADAWTNQRLGAADNAVLAAALLAPTAGTELVVAVPGPDAQRTGLGALVPRRVRHALWWAVAVFGLAAWWQARRLGAPVDERLPVEIPGSELVRAVGELLQRSGDRGEAARLLADELHAELAEALGTDAGTSVEELAGRVAARTGHDPAAVARTLRPPVPGDDEALLELARRAARLRTAVRAATARR